MSLFTLQHNCDFLETVSASKPAYFAFLYQPRHINYIVHFCFIDIKATTLAIDFNLCNLWVTDTTYRNKRLINLETKKHPVFLGPIMIHFTRDDFARSALELLYANKDVRKLNQVGVDMESAIYNEFQHHFPDLCRLLCVRRLSKRDKSKLVKWLAKTNLSASQRQKSSLEILKDIPAGGFYKFSLAEATDIFDFDIKLFSLKEKWNRYAQGFLIVLKEKKVMIATKLALFKVQERGPILTACTFKATWNQCISYKNLARS